MQSQRHQKFSLSLETGPPHGARHVGNSLLRGKGADRVAAHAGQPAVLHPEISPVFQAERARVGLSLEEIRAVLDDLPAGRAPTREDWHELAKRWKPWLDERIAALERLRDQLSSCIGCGCLSLDRCALYNPDDAAGSLGTGPRYLLGDSPQDLRLQQ